MEQTIKLLVVDFDEVFYKKLVNSIKATDKNIKLDFFLNDEDLKNKLEKTELNILIVNFNILVKNGFSFFLKLKENKNIAVVGLISCFEKLEEDLLFKLYALDGFIFKTDKMLEVLTRIEYIHRFNYIKNKNFLKQIIEVENLKIDIKNYEIFICGEKKKAAPKEVELLYKLVTNENVLFTREQLLDEVWGYKYIGSSRTVDVHIKRLREKLKEGFSNWQIETVWGVGYKFKKIK